MGGCIVKLFKPITMSRVTVKPITDSSLSVRKKVVHKNMDNDWVAISELTPSESKAFANYKEAVLDRGITPMPEITYTF